MSTLPFERPQEYIGVWAGDDDILLKAFGDEFMCPRRTQVAVAGQGRFRFGAAKGRDGKALPGTIMLQNAYVRNDQGGEEAQFDARAVCLQLYTNKALLARGFTVVLNVDDVEAAQAAGRPMWEEQQSLAWQEIIRGELDRQAMWDKRGVPAPPSPDAALVKQAREGLARLNAQNAGNQFSREDLVSVLGGGQGQAPTQPAVITPAAVPSAFAPPPGAAELALAAAELYTEAEQAGIKVLKEEMALLFKGDRSTMREIQSRLEAARAEVA